MHAPPDPYYLEKLRVFSRRIPPPRQVLKADRGYAELLWRQGNLAREAHDSGAVYAPCLYLASAALGLAELLEAGASGAVREALPKAVVAACLAYPIPAPGLLLATGGEVGELGVALQGVIRRYPKTHKKYATIPDAIGECLDVCVMAARVALEGDPAFEPDEREAAWRRGAAATAGTATSRRPKPPLRARRDGSFYRTCFTRLTGG